MALVLQECVSDDLLASPYEIAQSFSFEKAVGQKRKVGHLMKHLVILGVSLDILLVGVLYGITLLTYLLLFIL